MAQYRKKPVLIEAVRFTGANHAEIKTFARAKSAEMDSDNECLLIHTLEGTMTARAGDYIIRNVHGEFYPCREDIFHQNYEPVEEV